MFERYTERARQVIILAQDEARRVRHDHIGLGHILWGLCAEEHGVACRALAEHDITVVDVHRALERIPPADEEITGQLPFAPRTKKLLESALREALSLGHNYVGTEHVLLGLLREPEGIAIEILTERGASVEEIRDTVLRLLRAKTSGVAETTADLRGHSRAATFHSAFRSAEAYKRGWNDGYNAGVRESAR